MMSLTYIWSKALNKKTLEPVRYSNFVKITLLMVGKYKYKENVPFSFSLSWLSWACWKLPSSRRHRHVPRRGLPPRAGHHTPGGGKNRHLMVTQTRFEIVFFLNRSYIYLIATAQISEQISGFSQQVRTRVSFKYQEHSTLQKLSNNFSCQIISAVK